MDSIDTFLVVFIVIVVVVGAGGFLFYNYTNHDID
jgi:hypothetical protein